jgi:hypothetical protein
MNLMLELGTEGNGERYRELARSSAVLFGFPTPSDLVEYLHSTDIEDRQPSCDDVLVELLRAAIDPGLRQLWNRILLLVFIPTIHRTMRQLSTVFPSLARDDIAQHLTTVLLEFLTSNELRSRRSHLAFTIARKIRRAGFRWAIRESHITLEEEHDGRAHGSPQGQVFRDPFCSAVLLAKFLDTSERRGWMSSAERELLAQSKIEGISCQELSRGNGHSAVAIQHQISRLIKRLRQHAQVRVEHTLQQLELFPK